MKVNKGFTLIELMVVIAVIVVLMAILLPTLSQARAQAKRVHCASSLRQTGMALLNYANDNSGFGPYTHRDATPWNDDPSRWRYTWNSKTEYTQWGLLFPYMSIPTTDNPSNMKTPAVMLCTSREKTLGADVTAYLLNPSVGVVAASKTKLYIMPPGRVAGLCTLWWWDGTHGYHRGEGSNYLRVGGDVTWINAQKTRSATAWDWSQLERMPF